MTNEELQGEIWEIEGILYFVLVAIIHNQLLQYCFGFLGILALIGGFNRQLKERKKK